MMIPAILVILVIIEYKNLFWYTEQRLVRGLIHNPNRKIKVIMNCSIEPRQELLFFQRRRPQQFMILPFSNLKFTLAKINKKRILCIPFYRFILTLQTIAQHKR